jgi:TonB-dependent starch-binding outer membrane protein SusC
MMKLKKRSIRSGLLSLAVLLNFTVLAQTKTVTGLVLDALNNPLSGVTVTVKNKNTATSTNAKGEFTITASTGDVLVFTSVGFQKMEETVGATPGINITLATLSTNLNEVIVTGYGTAKKKDLTGAIATVSSKDFQKGVITTPEQLIQGKVPGLSIISNGGKPGSGSVIRIRGGASLSASNTPLIVIDGVPLDNGNVAGGSNPLAFINPNDIESFTVLKDASSAAIYGTRASNGVIIITTKKGKGGKAKVSFSSVNSISSITKKVDVLTADEFRNVINTYGSAAQKAQLGTASTDWQDVIYQTAYSTDNNISLSGGLNKLPYRVSFGYQRQTGVLRTDKVQRTSLALVLNPTFFDNHLKLDINLKGSAQENRFATDVIGGAVTFDPTQPVYATTKKERFGGYFEWLDPTTTTGLMNLAGRNPLGLLEQRNDVSSPARSIGNITLDYKFHFLPELRANLNLGYDASVGKGHVFVKDSAASAYVAGGLGGSYSLYKQTKFNKVLEFYLSYSKDFKSIKSRFDILGGYAYNNYLTKIFNYPNYYASGRLVPNSAPVFPYNKPENTLISYFGRTNFSYDDRYLLTATIRRDGSSRFAPATRWGLFPSVALAWNIKQEAFASGSKAFSALKIRASYGITGQQDGIGNYDFKSFYALSNTSATYQFGNEFIQGYRPGGYYPNRKWEETATSNVALDFAILNNRISGTIDFYYKKTKDLLNNLPQPAGTNFSAFIVVNVGEMRNKGVELSLNTIPVKNDIITWNADFNVTYNKNTISNLTVLRGDKNYAGVPTGGIPGGIGGGFSQVHQVGYSRNTFNLYKQVYDQQGKPIEGLFEDLNRDGIINQNDLFKNKSAVPSVFAGFSNSITYKKWNAGFVMRASFDNYVYNAVFSAAGALTQFTGNSVLYNGSSHFLKTGFKGSDQQLLSDYFIQNASFLRMDNLNIGYDFGRVLSNRRANLRLNASVQNVFVITKYEGLDPEISSGVDNNLYPRPRTFALAINIDF